MRHAIGLLMIAFMAVGCSAGPVADEPAFTTDPLETEAPLATLDAAEAPTFVTFKAITLKGKGNKVAKFKIPADAVGIATITYSGGSNFIVSSIDAGGDELDLLVNEIGKYKGTVLFDETDGAHSVAFKVESSGSWKIVIRPLSAAAKWDGKATLKGSGDAVYQIAPPSSGLVTLNLAHKGDGNFMVAAYSPDGIDLLANEIDNFKGETLLPDGTFLLEITAGGSWSAKPS